MIVVVGLDGTCCDAAWRRDKIEEAGWDCYHGLCVGDQPIEVVRDLVNSLHAAGHVTAAITSRPERWRTVTMAWMLRNNFNFEVLRMRPTGDFCSEVSLKLAMAPRDSQLIIDDSDAVIAAFRAAGVTCLQVGRPA